MSGESITFLRGDYVQHKDGRRGMVERVTPSRHPVTHVLTVRVTVQFANHWRSSVIESKNLTHVDLNQLNS